MVALYIAHVVLYALFAWYFLRLPNAIREVSFYGYLTALLILGGFLGSIYSIPISEHILLSGGNLLYGAFMMTVTLFVLAEANLIILKHVIRLVIIADLFNFLLARLMNFSLSQPGIVNTFNVPAGPFEVSAAFIVLGGVLIILELLFLTITFEWLRKYIRQKNILAFCYILLFIGVICADGTLFPLIAFGPNAEVLQIIIGNLPGKILLASSFSVPLYLFVIFYRERFERYIHQAPFEWSLMIQNSGQLMQEMAHHKRLQQQSSAFFEHSSEGIVVTDANFEIKDANPAFLQMTGYQQLPQINLWTIVTQVEKESVSKQLQNGHSLQLEACIISRDGTPRSTMMSISPLFEQGRLVNHVTSLVNIDDLKNIQQRLAFLAEHDVTTELPNRRALEQTITTITTDTALMIVDLDHFKDVNDSYGHPMGDHVLVETAQRLLAINEGQWFRIGGDEFAVLLDTNTNTQSLLTYAGTVQQQLVPVFELPNHARIHISASIGVSRYPQLCKTPEQLLQQADVALYQAKQTKRGSFTLYSQDMSETLKQRLEMENALRDALQHGHLTVYFQPQCNVQNGHVTGAEALVRWLDPDKGLIPPSDFIRLAEETGLIEQIGELVLRQTCELGTEWRARNLPALKLSVNISPYQLRFVNLVDMTRRILAETGFTAEWLELEMTESALMEREQEVIPQLVALQEMGISIAIDDFGTGYSSLAYLKNFPLDTLKIDRSFLEGIPANRDSRQLTQTIISLGHNLNYKIVAEGVETQAQLDFLKQLGCDTYQGYLKSPPLPVQAFMKLIDPQQQRA
ncbi:sensor domain-containing protein [Gynuella sunshinyii]|uniref:cyclic-guanylate-specific phosphodiesterase n=1 Tax=Gynuella sunshinyii YC6258 TaxID=1445510 RepID=A0A0C5VS12_9GAMM|nr:GGDEF domain-containing phosphodiesterase [Gynuella sunshinyii]AJQ97016.1 putative signal transduction protein containing a membrane domain, an EAL and a GGDEF domain [Gynuella sunshinyii YC6258]